MNWTITKDGDSSALSLFARHYSFYRYKDGRKRKLFVGPGEKMVLITPNSDALFIWRKFKSDNGQKGINCAVFRNESKIKSSVLIEEAMLFAFERWPGERLYTYVDSRKIKSTNPGYCFIKAGWKKCGETIIHKLTILEFQRQQ
jgi:hypothetical protein